MKRYNKYKILYLFVAFTLLILPYIKVKAQAPGGTSLNVELWLSADKIDGSTLPANGAAVSSWVDLLNSSRKFKQNTNTNADYNTLPRFKYTGMNYHPAVEFYKSTESTRRNESRKLIYDGNFPVGRNDNKSYYTFWVSRLASGSSGYSTVLSFNQSAGDNHGWSGTSQIWHETRTTNYAHQGIGKSYGLGIAFRQNGGAAATRTQAQYQDGTARTAAIAANYLGSQANAPAVIGNSTLTSTEPFFGEVQEIIVLSASGNPVIDLAELNKVQSFLAIKYGLTINGDFNYVNSDGNVVWNKALYPTFNYNIFGVGRDNATGLYQKQSVSADDSQVKIYIGDQLADLNINNTSDLLSDKEFLLLGSNRSKQAIPYKHDIGAVFGGGDLSGNVLDKEINQRKGLTFRAQTGTTRTNFTNVKIVADALYVLVSSDPDFAKGNTRIYAVDAANNTASIEVNAGEYISFVYFEGVPGGLKTNLELWLSSDFLLGKSEDMLAEDANVTAWTDLSGNDRNFAQNAAQAVPKFSYGGLNFNPAVEFYQDLSSVGDSDDEPNLITADRQRKLVSSSAFPIDANKSYYTFWVSEVDPQIAGTTSNTMPNNGNDRRGVVFTFNPTAAQNNHGWNINRSATSSPVVALETSTATTYTKHPTQDVTAAIGAMIRPNDTSTDQKQYLNGIANPITPRAMTSGSNTAIIGNSTTGTDNPFFGNVQEIVVYSGTQGATIPDDDLKKIHTYLAVKYGISLDGQDYITSKGIQVWNGTDTKNSGYNSHIFGLGRDNPSALYVKQSTSSSAPVFTAFVGDELTELNANNNGSIPDDTYVMFGSNGLNGLGNYRYNLEDNPVFLEGTLEEDINYRDNNVWRVQLTNTTEFTLKINAPGKYILISDDDPTFDPLKTRIHKIDTETGCAEVTLKDGQYICFAYFAKGPGGVVEGLRMWLDAGEKDFISVNQGEVSEWRDKSQISNTRYSFQAVNAANKIPGYDTASVHTNFYPAVDYRVQGEYLSTNKGPASVASPQGYTVFHVIFNDFIKANRSYFMGFGSKISGSSARRPVFGMRGYDNGVRGRLFETGGATVQGTQPLFSAGATSINIQTVNRNTKQITFESNGRSETLNNNSIGNGSRMSGVGVLGGGSAAAWQMQGVMAQSIFYEKVLNETEKDQIYSYLGLKYAVTLRMPTAYKYKFSDGTVLWDGTTAPLSTYHNNVAALIYDKTSDLANNVARSTDEGAVITMMIRGHEDATTGQGEKTLMPGEEDLSALIWGNNGKSTIYNFTAAEVEALCGAVKSKTDKIWLVKKTDNLEKLDVSIRILQGDFGYYVSPGYQIVLLVADSPTKLENNQWDLAIPSHYLKDVDQQAIDFTFASDITYFSLGIKELPGACETCDFEGTKKIIFNRQSWTPNGLKEKLFNLGDDGSGNDTDFTVNVKTDVNAITWSSRYPRYSSQNSLRLTRRGNAIAEQITEITPSVAAATKFQIFNLDREGSRYKEVQIYGQCEGGMVIPKLSEASNRSSYSISGNVARAKRTPSSAYTNDRGKLNVSFEFPVEKIIIKERSTGGTTGSQTFGISPLEFSCPAPIPPYSEAGLAFSKQATDTVIYCGPVSMVDYTFRIYSANCERKGVNISDTLPEHLYWDPELVHLSDIAKEDPNFKLTVSDYLTAGDNRILTIDNLTVPGSAEPFIFTAQAKFIDDDIIVGKDYENQAWLRTTIIVEDLPVEIDPQPSSDFYRGDGFKSRTHVKDGGARLRPVTVKVEKTRDCYGASDEITITLKINNPNSDNVTDMILDVEFNEEFEYINNSLSSSMSGIGSNPSFETDGGTKIPGLFYLEGFTLPGSTESTISFKVKAPLKDDLVGEVDENGNAIDWNGDILTGPYNPEDQAITDMVIGYTFNTDMDDYCISSSLVNADGEIIIPFCRSKECIITNRMLQSRIK